MNLPNQVFSIITKQKLTRPGDTVVIGVSGGMDSVVLLHILNKLRLRLGINLHIAHFNHQLRTSANRDENFVRSLASAFNLPITVSRRKKSLQSKMVSEDQARQWRFAFFARVAGQTKAQSIALAHHQNDLAETVLMRLLRGTGLLGLRGILSKSNINDIKMIRPLLNIQRASIEQYAKANHLQYCHDETNDQTYYLRNKIRLKLLPEMVKNYNNNFYNTLIDLAYTSQADYDFLLIHAQNLFDKNVILGKFKCSFKLNFLMKQHVSTQRMLLRLAFETLLSNSKQLELKHIQEVEEMLTDRPSGAIVHWPQSIEVLKSKNHLTLQL